MISGDSVVSVDVVEVFSKGGVEYELDSSGTVVVWLGSGSSGCSCEVVLVLEHGSASSCPHGTIASAPVVVSGAGPASYDSDGTEETETSFEAFSRAVEEIGWEAILLPLPSSSPSGGGPEEVEGVEGAPVGVVVSARSRRSISER